MKIELEDTFGDILRKATRGTKTSLETLSSRTRIAASRLSELLADASTPTEAEVQALARELSLDPKKLAESGARRWYPQDQPMPPFLEHQKNAPQPSNGYWIVDREANAAAFVDPAGRPATIFEGFRRHGVEPAYFFLTHKHADHTDALSSVRKSFPKAEVVIHSVDGATLGNAARDAIAASDEMRLPFGKGEIRVLYTPGHTDGSVCFLYKGALFTGDTMFSGSVGGLFGERYGYEDLLSNIRTKLFALPADTMVFPGHGPPSTIAQERDHNPFFLNI